MCVAGNCKTVYLLFILYIALRRTFLQQTLLMFRPLHISQFFHFMAYYFFKSSKVLSGRLPAIYHALMNKDSAARLSKSGFGTVPFPVIASVSMVCEFRWRN